jgi:transcriptional regulator with XRE-family HTH domain
MTLMRSAVGEVLRDFRQKQGRTLREVSKDARVSLGYLSEVERGQKEASSEMIAAICDALQTPLSSVLREVYDRVLAAEQFVVPDTIPADFLDGLLSRSSTMRPAKRFANSTAYLSKSSNRQLTSVH